MNGALVLHPEALRAGLRVLAAADAATPSTTPAVTPSAVATAGVATVHATGATLPTWGLIFLVAVFVVAVAIALPASRRRSRGASQG